MVTNAVQTFHSVELSPHAAEVLHILTTAATDEDHPVVRQPVDTSRLSDLELGALLPAAYRLPAYRYPAASARWALEEAVRQRQPRFTPESCHALFAALTDAVKAGNGGDAMLAVSALLRCEGSWSEELERSAGTLVRSLIAYGRLDYPYALLALSRLAGGLTRRVVSGVFKWPLGPIARDEVDLLVSLGPRVCAVVAEVNPDRSHSTPPQLPGAWQRLAAVPEYRVFAREALLAAEARIADIHSGKRPYEADKAFARDEVAALGRATRVALIHDASWLLEILQPLLLGVAVAPTSARTLPSQALLYEVARAVGDFPTPEALAALRAASAVVRHKGVPKQLGRMLKRIERNLADRPDVALRLPDLGFGHDGVRTVDVGDYQAVITVSDEVDLAWRRAGGKPSASVPAAVRRDHADEVKQLRAQVKQVRGELATFAATLEAGLVLTATHRYQRWRDELAAGPLGWSVVRRLIWEVEVPGEGWRAVIPAGTGPGDEPEGGFEDVTGAPVDAPVPDAGIRLWHPLRAGVEEVRAWRDLLTQRRLRQPFKQAFREVYLLTPAEVATETYSNRFAAHIVHYRQLYALLRSRGWTTTMLGPWDGGSTADSHRVLAGGQWRIGLRLNYLEHQPEGIECAGTDQLWFDRMTDGAWRTVPLAQIPEIVFSEALRDVDLFVSVTSIATDPNWTDRGPQYAGYWRDASFAELTAVAKMRRSALARIIPRTKIADRCTLTDRYLVVRGDLREYKIHIGSGNILMEPDGSYLCIVPDRRQRREEVFLPFEEDRLALVLSKAFLLADDTRITDPSILAQIRRKP
jgi:Domain of unknown function (DUF4132)